MLADCCAVPRRCCSRGSGVPPACFVTVALTHHPARRRCWVGGCSLCFGAKASLPALGLGGWLRGPELSGGCPKSGAKFKIELLTTPTVDCQNCAWTFQRILDSENRQSAEHQSKCAFLHLSPSHSGHSSQHSDLCTLDTAHSTLHRAHGAQQVRPKAPSKRSRISW